MEQLYIEIKKMIIETLNLEEMSIEDIDTYAPLFGNGLGLDSIDALELGLAVKNAYNVTLSTETDDMKKHFYSVESLAKFIDQQRQI